MPLLFRKPFCCLLNFLLAFVQLLRLPATAFFRSLSKQEYGWEACSFLLNLLVCQRTTERPITSCKIFWFASLMQHNYFCNFQLAEWMPKLIVTLKKKCEKFIRAGLRCLISLLLMQSKPGAFLISKYLMILSSSFMRINSSWSSIDFNGE